MQWEKFKKLRKRHPFLLDLFRQRGYALRTEEEIKRFVVSKIGSVTFEPFKNIDLNSKPSLLRTSSKHPNFRGEKYTDLEYHIACRFIGDNTFYTREIHSGESIRSQLDIINNFKNEKRVWEEIVKKVIDVEQELRNVNIVIYPFPKGYKFTSPPPEPSLKERTASYPSLLRGWIRQMEAPPPQKGFGGW